MEVGQSVVFDHRRTPIAVHPDRGTQPRVRRGGRLNDTERTVREADRRPSDVLDLDALVHQAIGPGKTSTGSPRNHTSRSTKWCPWFITAPPPSSAHVPRQPAES